MAQIPATGPRIIAVGSLSLIVGESELDMTPSDDDLLMLKVDSGLKYACQTLLDCCCCSSRSSRRSSSHSCTSAAAKTKSMKESTKMSANMQRG
jgi:hypothetical protein